MQSSLHTRITSNYEDRYRIYLTRRCPVLLRLDIKSAHSLTKAMKRPFDHQFMECMNETALGLCQEIQGCKLAYIQSDEISLLLIDYDDLQTDAWFDYNLQKMVSISASIAAFYFNQEFRPRFLVDSNYYSHKLKCFDSRAFNVPREEVNNAFYDRQLDCTRNSITMVAQSLYSHKELNYKSSNERQEMIFQKGLNWNDFPTSEKRGRCVIKGNDGWFVDNEIPKFNEDKDYIERFVWIDQ